MLCLGVIILKFITHKLAVIEPEQLFYENVKKKLQTLLK